MEKILNRIIDRVNWNCPVEGAGIRISDGKGGKIIELASLADGKQPAGSAQQQQGGGPTGQWVTLTVFDAGNNPVTLNLFTDGNPPGTSTLTWIKVNTVDPSTCAPSTIKVLENNS